MKKLYEIPLCNVAPIELGSVLCGSGETKLSMPDTEKKEKTDERILKKQPFMNI